MRQIFHRFWNNPWLLSVCSGILLGFSFPPFPFPFLQFPAFIFLFRLITLSTTPKEAAYYSYPGFLIWNLIATYWLMLATVPAGIAAILANSALMAFVFMLLFLSQKRLHNGWLIALLQTAFWMSFEYLHHHWDLTWPWLTLGNGWSSLPSLVQYISVTGFWGISCWVILVSSLFYQGLRRHQKAYKIAAGLLLILGPVISLLMRPSILTEHDQTVETVIAQPNFNSYKEIQGIRASQKAFDRLVKITDSVRTPDTRLILWPENGIYPFLSNRHTQSFASNRMKNKLIHQAEKWGSTLIGGTPYIEYYPQNHHPKLPQWAGNTPYLTFNAAVGFSPNGHVEVYRKHNLVPVIERFPFVHFFNAIDVFGWINWANIQQFGEGQQPNNFESSHVKFPALICYDSVYPGWVRHFVQRGAGFLTIITNDGWWGNTSGHIQHFQYDRLRAIEFHRWVIQDSNNGTSGVIAPDGSVQKTTAFGTRTAFRYNMPVLKTRTFYTRYGDWLPVAMLFISFAGLVLLFINRK